MCPYCSKFLGFDDVGKPQAPESGWRVFRYCEAVLEVKKIADGEPASTALGDWALNYRFMNPGSHQLSMRNKRPRMKLSHDEEIFLRHWIYDEWHFREGQGPAKRIQLTHQIAPADLATIIAASMSGRRARGAAEGPPPTEPPVWPWADNDHFIRRVTESRMLLAEKQPDRTATN